MQPKHVTIEDYEVLARYFTAPSYRLSAYLLPSLIAWAECPYFFMRYIERGEHAWFVANCRDEPEKSHLLLPVGREWVPPSELAGMARDVGVTQVWFVPQEYLTRYAGEIDRWFSVTEHPEYHDYLYTATDMAELAGRCYAKKRNLIGQFDREFIQQGRVATGPILDQDIADCLCFLERWMVIHRSRNANDLVADDDAMLQCEKRALECSLTHRNRLGWRGLLVRIDGQVAGLTLWAPIDRDVAVLSFEKAMTQHKGLYQFLDRECGRQISAQGFTLINKESDMGDLGLRQAKHSYYPQTIEKAMLLRLV